jgi:hypothetical protein
MPFSFLCFLSFSSPFSSDSPILHQLLLLRIHFPVDFSSPSPVSYFLFLYHISFIIIIIIIVNSTAHNRICFLMASRLRILLTMFLCGFVSRSECLFSVFSLKCVSLTSSYFFRIISSQLPKPTQTSILSTDFILRGQS